MDVAVASVERILVEVPYRPVPDRNMARQCPDWQYFEIVEVELEDGSIGYGETMCFYTWGETTDADVDRAIGRNAATLMWDDSLGAGLQMALFDAVGRALGVPIHDLLGRKLHDSVPLSWWAIDMPPEDWVAECEAAIDSGYTHVKFKARPWFDFGEQVRAVCEATPDWFRVNLDFNETLLDAERGLPLLRELEQYPQVWLFEGPITNTDVDGYAALRRALDVPVARHYYGREPEPSVVLKEDLCDGFVVSGGPNDALAAGSVSAMAGKPLFLELVGTDITAAFSSHVGSVLSACEWPAITCRELFDRSLLAEGFDVVDGSVSVPDGPGLGVDVDRDTVDALEVDPDEVEPSPRRLVETSWPDGTSMYFASGQQMPECARDGGMPYFEGGVTTRLVPDDGSDRWRELHERARDGPVTVRDG